MYRIHGMVLPGGAVRDVHVVDGRLTLEPVDGAETLIEDVFLLPGLVDAHAHLSLYSPAGDDAPAAVRVRASAREHLAAGVLAIREPGSPDHESVGLGAHEGLPRTVTGGRFLAPPGMYFPGLAREVEPDGLPDAAVEEYHVSGSWAKIIGDTPIGDDLRRTYDDQSLAEAVRQVHEAGGRVAIHCVLAETVHAAVEAGVDSLEHGSFLQSDQVAEVARRGIAWVPTRAIDATVRQLIRDLGYTADRVRHVEERLDRQGESLRAAVDAGVMVLAGTDAGMVPHGLIVREVELLLAAGIAPAVAIGAASWTARSWLGLPGIEEGAPADLVAYREDPRESAATLARPALVILDGRVVSSSIDRP